ncbi:unnamed protein product, partial [marine sediment metagenome]
MSNALITTFRAARRRVSSPHLIDLGWHQKEFQRKTSFAYTVMGLDEKECLGCMYIYPSSNSEYDAEIVMWVRQSEVENG